MLKINLINGEEIIIESKCEKTVTDSNIVIDILNTIPQCTYIFPKKSILYIVEIADK